MDFPQIFNRVWTPLGYEWPYVMAETDYTFSANGVFPNRYAVYRDLTINAGIVVTGAGTPQIIVCRNLKFGNATSKINCDGLGGIGGVGNSNNALYAQAGGGALGYISNEFGRILSAGGAGGGTANQGGTAPGKDGVAAYVYAQNPFAVLNCVEFALAGGGGGGAGSSNGTGASSPGAGGVCGNNGSQAVNSPNGGPGGGSGISGGGGGGAGGTAGSNGTGGNGGNGGGIVIIYADTILGANGIISANGMNGTNAVTGGGGGGGGGGGTIICYTRRAIAVPTFYATGGVGGNAASTGGAGGNGGAGFGLLIRSS